ncbi:MAG TPA: hypothetical protein VNM38_13265 [Solirubrobacterales bacterium]|nr:hypothetical protein [Solirubrobacterales bacterium]
MARAEQPPSAERDGEVTARLREAIIDLVCERSYAQTSVVAICDRVGVEVDVFTRAYGSKEQAFLRIYSEESERLLAATRGAYDSEETWRDALRAAAYATARWIQRHPRETRFCVLEALSAGEAARLEREKTLWHFIDLVDRSRQGLDDPGSVPQSFAAAIVGAIAEMLLRRIAAGKDLSRAESLVPEMMYIAVRPYVNKDEAEQELSLPPPPHV